MCAFICCEGLLTPSPASLWVLGLRFQLCAPDNGNQGLRACVVDRPWACGAGHEAQRVLCPIRQPWHPVGTTGRRSQLPGAGKMGAGVLLLL